MKCIKLGNGFYEDMESGLLIFVEYWVKVEKYVEIGIEEGVKLEIGGKCFDDFVFQNGFFYEFIIFLNCKFDMWIV